MTVSIRLWLTLSLAAATVGLAWFGWFPPTRAIQPNEPPFKIRQDGSYGMITGDGILDPRRVGEVRQR
jgi:hypothetical protein